MSSFIMGLKVNANKTQTHIRIIQIRINRNLLSNTYIPENWLAWTMSNMCVIYEGVISETTDDI